MDTSEDSTARAQFIWVRREQLARLAGSAPPSLRRYLEDELAQLSAFASAADDDHLPGYNGRRNAHE